MAFPALLRGAATGAATTPLATPAIVEGMTEIEPVEGPVHITVISDTI